MIENSHGDLQPIFIDLIIKLKICRAYANKMKEKPLTAHRYLNDAAKLIQKIRDNQQDEYSGITSSQWNSTSLQINQHKSSKHR